MKNEKVKITSFGTFKKSIKNKRIGRNPKTKKEFIITARAVVKFKASEQLKKRINNE
jgi:integration host factor subunit alpha